MLYNLYDIEVCRGQQGLVASLDAPIMYKVPNLVQYVFDIPAWLDWTWTLSLSLNLNLSFRGAINSTPP